MTSNEPSVADHDGFTVRRTIKIAAQVDKVWIAVTDPAHISRWFGHTVLVGEGTAGHGTITWPGEDAIPIRVEAVDPLRSISYRWCNDDSGGRPPAVVSDDEASTVFTFTLEPTDEGTRLTVVETGFETSADPAVDLERHREGWDAELDKLVASLEVGPR